MTGAESVKGLKRLWQGLLVQLVCIALPVVGLAAGIAFEASSGSDAGYGVSAVVSVASLVIEIVAWVEIVAVLSRFKDASRSFVRASRWYLASMGLLLIYLMGMSASGALEAIGLMGAPFLAIAESVVSVLKFAMPLVAAWYLVAGYADYLESIGEPDRGLKSLRALRTALIVIAVLEVAFSIPTAIAFYAAPESPVYSASALLLTITYFAGFCAQIVVVRKAHSVWKTVEGIVG